MSNEPKPLLEHVCQYKSQGKIKRTICEGLQLVGCKTISKVVTRWILSVGKYIISNLTVECVQCSKVSIRCASVEACLWNLLHMTVIWALNETLVNFSTFHYCYLTCVWHVQGIELHLNSSFVHCTTVHCYTPNLVYAVVLRVHHVCTNSVGLKPSDKSEEIKYIHLCIYVVCLS